MTPEALLEMARKAMENAYAPYSRFQVGAALLCSDGTVFTGCNVENAAFSPTICAERVAFSQAVAGGHRSFAALAVCGGPEGKITRICTPCGVCRQVMAEFCDAAFPIYLGRADGYETRSLGQLLPESFDL